MKGKKVSSGSASSGRKIRLDELQWKSVELPDRMDDYEGLYGLEEIDGIDIVKDADTGLLSYQANDAETTIKAPEKFVEEQEWSGFSDGDEPLTTNLTDQNTGKDSRKRPAETATETETAPLTKKQKKAKATKAKKSDFTPTAPTSTSASTSAFAAIDGSADDNQDTDISAWQPLGLSPDTLAALSTMHFSVPTAIQSATIPEILSGRDMIGKASTGSGKTLAFGIPIFETWLQVRHTRQFAKRALRTGPSPSPAVSTTKAIPHAPLALIITPTRELAHQISAHLAPLGSALQGGGGAGNDTRGPVIATVTGGLSIQKQTRIMANADIVIGTPGRLWEIMSGKAGVVGALRRVQFLVLDEADRLLSKGNFKELDELLRWLDQKVTDDGDTADAADEGHDGTEDDTPPRQTLVFSATFHKGLQQKLAGKAKGAGFDKNSTESMEYLLARLKFQEDQKPKYVDVNPSRQMAGGLKEGLVECAGLEKDLYLYSILLLHQSSRSLVFVNSISAVRRLVPFLQNLGLNALALHSQMPQKARLRSIERFTGQTHARAMTHKGSILVATDVAARGLDIPHVHLVVHYHLPRASDAYVHRSGRTARAGETGTSILICGPEEVAGVRRLVAKVHATADQDDKQQGHFIRNLNIDRRVVARLKPRATLAKQLADVSTAHEKKSAQTELFKEAAEDLGIDYDSEEMEMNDSKGKRGRGAGRLKKERAARSLTKDEVRSVRAELSQLLKQRVNVGVSERYLTSGSVDIDQLLAAGADAAGGDFLGLASGAGLDD